MYMYVHLSLKYFQKCLVYLCGTKYDLVEENEKARGVESGIVRDYVDGESHYLLVVTFISVL